MTQDANAELRELAKKQLKKKSDFKNFMGIYLGVALLVTTIWFLTTPGAYFWPIWAIFGMGIAAFFLALDAYGPFSGRGITEADIDREVERRGRKG